MRLILVELEENKKKTPAKEMSGTSSDDVVSALSQTKKGQLKYDTKWKEEGRTEEIVNKVEEGLFSINCFSPNQNGYVNRNSFNGANQQQTMSGEFICNNDNEPLNSTVKSISSKDHHKFNETINIDPIPHFHPLSPSTAAFQAEKDANEELIRQYELERNEKVQERVEETASKLRSKYDAILAKMDSERRLINNNFILLKIQAQKAYEDEYASLVRSLEMSEDNQQILSAERSESDKAATANKLKEFQERQKLLERQKELRLQKLAEYRQTVTSAKEAISRSLAECEARLEAEKQSALLNQMQLKLETSAAEELQHYRTLLLAAISELDVLLLTTSGQGAAELTAEHVKLAIERQQQAIQIAHHYNALLTEQVKKLYVEGVLGSKVNSQQQPVIQNPSAPRTPKPKTQLTMPKSSLFEPSQQPPSASTPKPSSSTTSTSSTEPEFNCPAKLLYVRSQLELMKVEAIVERFKEAPANKERRQTLQTFINTRINTMCNEPIGKLIVKTKKLLEVLSCKQVTSSNGQSMVCSPKDGSLHFAMHTAVKTFLNVTYKQKNMALRLASVVAVLWSRLDPLFGRILLCQLYRMCPYAIPYFPEREADQSEEEWMVSCGYAVNSSGSISETKETFRERIYPLVQFYGALLQANIPEGRHPRDLEYAWHWLARLLNTHPPVAVMSSLCLDAFLSVTGHKMLAVYGRQFVKVVRFISRTYMAELAAVTPNTDQQSLMKFKSLLEDFEHKMKALSRGGRALKPADVARSLIPETMELVPDSFFRM